jgi:hypothetical protein
MKKFELNRLERLLLRVLVVFLTIDLAIVVYDYASQWITFCAGPAIHPFQ